MNGSDTRFSCLLQCIITIPKRYAQSSPAITVNPSQIDVTNLSGNTVIFDSFSSEDEVKLRNTVVNSVSQFNEVSSHFQANFNVNVSTRVSSVLSPSMVSAYRVTDRRAARGKKKTPLPKADTRGGSSPIEPKKDEGKIIEPLSFEQQIAIRKRQCAMLVDEIAPSLAQSLSTLEDQPDKRFKSSFADITMAGLFKTQPVATPFRSHLPSIASSSSTTSSLHTTPVSSSELVYCHVPTFDVTRFPSISGDEIAAISTLRDMLPS